MEGILHGKVAVITGASTAIARAACLTFAGQGARIVAADLDPAAAETTAGQVRDAGGEAIAHCCDLGDPTAADRLIADTVAAFGRVDIVLNNAGIALRPKSSQGPRREKEGVQAEAEIARFYNISIDGVRNACHAAIRQFEAQGGGGVIVTTDLAARLIDYGNVRYDPGQSAVAALTRTLALEAAEQGTRVNAFCPAGMGTSYEPDDAEGDREEAPASEPSNPLGCAVTPQACANAALFLASDLAATITGITLPVDGGVAASIAQRQ
jgi:NAD(P)-dependent dehydrogenase (short-subunit alcohol dehydrogenase family)